MDVDIDRCEKIDYHSVPKICYQVTIKKKDGTEETSDVNCGAGRACVDKGYVEYLCEKYGDELEKEAPIHCNF